MMMQLHTGLTASTDVPDEVSAGERCKVLLECFIHRYGTRLALLDVYAGIVFLCGSVASLQPDMYACNLTMYM